MTDIYEWDDVVTSYTPPPPGSPMPSTPTMLDGTAQHGIISVTEAYHKSLVSRMNRASRYNRHPAIRYARLMRMMNDVQWANTETLARTRFELLEIELTLQLENLAFAEFSGEDDDADTDDIRWRDDVDPHITETEYRERP